METYLVGKIVSKMNFNKILFENNNIGYLIETIDKINDDSKKVYVYKHIDLNGNSYLYGANEYNEIELFKKLIYIKTIGPRTATKIIRVVGFKNLKRIIDEKKFINLLSYGISEKVVGLIESNFNETKKEVKVDKKQKDLVMALEKIGYTKNDIYKAVKDFNYNNLSFDEALKQIIKKINNI